MQKIYFLIASMFYMVLFGLRVFEYPGIAKFCIPTFVLLTALYSFANAKDRTLKQGSLLLTLALAFAFCADVVINFFPNLPGVAIFCAVHICLIVYYLKKKPLERKEVLYIIPILAINIMFCIAIFPHITSKLFVYCISAYMLLLTLMLWRAICLFRDKNNLKIILGSTLFYLGDIAVIMMLPYGNSTALNVETWATYPPALFLLSLSSET